MSRLQAKERGARLPRAAEETPLSVVHAAREQGSRLAILGDGVCWSYDELARLTAERVSQLPLVEAAAGRAAEVELETGSVPFAVLGESSPDALLWIYALLQAGAPFVLLHPRWTPVERQEAVSASGARWLLQGNQVQRISEGKPRGGDAPSGPESAPPHPWACVLFTSGTTGAPRGAVLSRAALVASAAASAANLGWQDRDRWLLNLPLAHVGGLSVVTRTLIARSTLVLSRTGSFRPEDFLAEVAAREVTLASLVPTMLHRILSSSLPVDRAPCSLRALLLGGSRAEAQLVRRARSAGWPVLLTYGMTETGSQCATQRLPDEAADFASGGLSEVSVGPPLDGFEAAVRADDGRVLGEGEVGHLYVRGTGLFEGYLGTARPRTFDEDGWFATGDSATLEDGELRIVDRRVDLIISGGENVYPSEVETALLQLPEIEEACVVGLEDLEWGQRVGCAVVLSAGSSLETAQRGAAARLASYKRPTVWQVLHTLPRIGLAKLDRSAVRSLLSEAMDESE